MNEQSFAETFGSLRGDGAPNGVRRVLRGERVEVTLPYSEVCVHLRVAGQRRLVSLTDSERPMAQIFDEDGRPFSIPVLPGEAGLYADADGFYVRR